MRKSIDPQLQTMIDNMPEKTGKSLSDWYQVISKSGAEKHGEIMKVLKPKRPLKSKGKGSLPGSTA